jgi:hypothetical protein
LSTKITELTASNNASKKNLNDLNKKLKNLFEKL